MKSLRKSPRLHLTSTSTTWLSLQPIISALQPVPITHSVQHAGSLFPNLSQQRPSAFKSAEFGRGLSLVKEFLKIRRGFV